jgi:hypothetical protein
MVGRSVEPACAGRPHGSNLTRNSERDIAGSFRAAAVKSLQNPTCVLPAGALFSNAAKTVTTMQTTPTTTSFLADATRVAEALPWRNHAESAIPFGDNPALARRCAS